MGKLIPLSVAVLVVASAAPVAAADGDQVGAPAEFMRNANRI